MDRFDVHQHLTDQIIAMMEKEAGAYRCPWLQSARSGRPTNVASGNAYRGVNVLALWAAGSLGGFTSGVWGTYRQWNGKGAQVRKGEKAAFVVLWKELTPISRNEPATADESAGRGRFVARGSAVFAAEQVEGYNPRLPPPFDRTLRLGRADAVISKTGAQIRHEGERAYYRQATDTITLPPPELFVGTSTLTPIEGYYATLLHELVHWTGHPARCARELAGRFGEEAYAMEELVAELGAAFLCADLSISPAPRPDHAQYLRSWLKVLRNDKRAIFTAARHASAASAFIMTSEQAADGCGWPSLRSTPAT